MSRSIVERNVKFIWTPTLEGSTRLRSRQLDRASDEAHLRQWQIGPSNADRERLQEAGLLQCDAIAKRGRGRPKLKSPPKTQTARAVKAWALNESVLQLLDAVGQEVADLLNEPTARGRAAKRRMLALALELGRLDEFRRRLPDLLLLQASVPSTRVPWPLEEMTRPVFERLQRAGCADSVRRIRKLVAKGKLKTGRISPPPA
jgi:hypothetical protein